MWMRERLRRCGVRSISPIVDVTNYVMLELGQPMHAYDLAKLKGEIVVRFAKAGEQATLLDGEHCRRCERRASHHGREGAVGIAGVMGGQRTSVSADTTDVFLEVAYFAPDACAVDHVAGTWSLMRASATSAASIPRFRSARPSARPR